MKPTIVAFVFLFLTSCLGEGVRGIAEQQKILNKFDSLVHSIDSSANAIERKYPVDVFLDTTLKGNTLVVTFSGLAMTIKFNGEIAGGIAMVGDHYYKKAIEMRNNGKTERSCIVFTGATGALAVEEDTSQLGHTNYMLFKIVNNKIEFLDLEDDTVVRAEAPAVISCKFLMCIDNRYLLALKYHGTRTDTAAYFDEKGQYKGPLDQDVRYYGFRKTDLLNLTTTTFTIDGTGNEYADNADWEQLIKRAMKATPLTSRRKK